MHSSANWLDLADEYRTMAHTMRSCAARQAMLDIAAEHEAAAAEAAIRAVEFASQCMGFARRNW